MEGSIDPRCEKIRGTHWPVTVAGLFGTRVAETILASGPPTASTGRTYGCKRSDQTIEKLLRHGGRPHMGPGSEAGTTTKTPRAKDNPMLDKVDVLIIGSGASGAAVAWSLAETKMRILYLEQGDWVKSTDYPSNGRDWEARLFSDFAINPNRRARPTDYPINDTNSPIKVVNFNG